MEATRILSASILDLIFDDRNKEYGAYELRATYSDRIKKSLIIVFVITAVVITATALANSFRPKNETRFISKELWIQQIDPDKKQIPPPIPPAPDPPKTQPQERTIKFNNPVIVDEDVDPLPDKEEISKALVDDKTQDGTDDPHTVKTVDDLNNGTGIIQRPNEDNDIVHTTVDVEAKFNGNWVRFLQVNLNANVPVDHGAPSGRYTVMIQFIIDLDGHLSDIKALTSIGYGMEEEAVRVLKKALKWEPAFLNGKQVKALRRQPITFIVEEE